MKRDDEHLIHEKTAVPDTSPRVSRRRLLSLLAENLGCCNATIINGRAGTGKTTLAADFARHGGRPVSWYKVDAADSDLRMFCEYLSTTVRVQRLSMDTEPLLQSTEIVEDDRGDVLADAFVV
jgi:ATP/maltotriose-dependent transcriptional regulator MalT